MLNNINLQTNNYGSNFGNVMPTRKNIIPNLNFNNEFNSAQYNLLHQNTGYGNINGVLTPTEIDSAKQRHLNIASNKIYNNMGNLMPNDNTELIENINELPNYSAYSKSENSNLINNKLKNLGNLEQHPFVFKNNAFNQFNKNYGSSMLNNVQMQNNGNNYPQSIFYGNIDGNSEDGVEDNNIIYQNNIQNKNFGNYKSAYNNGRNVNDFFTNNNIPFMQNIQRSINCNSNYCPTMLSTNNNFNNNEDYNLYNFGINNNENNDLNQNKMSQPFNEVDKNIDSLVSNNNNYEINNNNLTPLTQQETFINNANPGLNVYTGNINKQTPDLTNYLNNGNANLISENTGSIIKTGKSAYNNNFNNNQINGQEEIYRLNYMTNLNNNFQQQNNGYDNKINNNDIDYYDIPDEYNNIYKNNNNENSKNINNFNQQNMQKYAEYLELINKKYGIGMPNKTKNQFFSNTNKNEEISKNYGTSINSVISNGGGIKLSNNNENYNENNEGRLSINNMQAFNNLESFNKRQEKNDCNNEDTKLNSIGYGSFQGSFIRSKNNFNNIPDNRKHEHNVQSIYLSNNIPKNSEYVNENGCQSPPIFNNFNNVTESTNKNSFIENVLQNKITNKDRLINNYNTEKLDENKLQQQVAHQSATSIQALTQQVNLIIYANNKIIFK